jgi:hypothetical protein
MFSQHSLQTVCKIQFNISNKSRNMYHCYCVNYSDVFDFEINNLHILCQIYFEAIK